MENSPYSFVVASDAFSDPDNDTLSYSATLANGQALPDWLSFDSGSRTFSGTPLDADVGSFIVRISTSDPDNEVATDDFALTVINTNEGPIALADSIGVSAEGGTSFEPLANDFDSDGFLVASTVTIVTPPQFGQLTNDADVWTYVPSATFPGQDSFVYTVMDDQDAVSEETQVDLIVRPFSETIVAGTSVDRSVMLEVETHFNSQTSLNLSSLTILIGSIPGSDPAELYGPEHGSAEIVDGEILYTPATGFTGPDTLYITVEDQNGITSDPTMISLNTVESRLENPKNPYDVNISGEVTAIDSLLVVNRLERAGGAVAVDAELDFGMGTNNGENEQFYYDVSGNGQITALDALLVINYIRSNPRPTGDAEAVIEAEWGEAEWGEAEWGEAEWWNADQDQSKAKQLLSSDELEPAGIVPNDAKMIATASTSGSTEKASTTPVPWTAESNDPEDETLPLAALDIVIKDLF